MDTVNLNYGGEKLRFVKSDKYIVLKPVSNRKRKIKNLDTSPEDVMDGFELYTLTEAENLDQLEKSLDLLRTQSDVLVGTHVYYTSDDNVPFIPTGELYVEFHPEAGTVECQALIDKHRLLMIESRGNNEYVFKVTTASGNPLKVAADMQREKELVAISEPSFATIAKVQGIVLPDDTLIKDQWHLKNTGLHRGTALSLKPGADARVIGAWDKGNTLGAKNVIVAVIDDGFDIKHPDLYGVDKIHAPWDFTRNTNEPIPGPDDAHGTACAGVAVGNSNSNGIVGAAPNCKLMPVRWGSALSDTQIERWFKYVADNGAWVVSCSWSAAARRFVLSTRMSKAIADCARNGRSGKGIVICFAAANSNTDINEYETYNGFATHPDVMAIAACTSIDTKSDYSCFGKSIFVTAPSSGAGGMGILTADVRGDLGYDPGDFTYDFGGTSSATPLVAGICALILSVNPILEGREVKDIIKATTRKIGQEDDYDEEGHSWIFGYGCINAEEAVAMAKNY